MFFVVQVVSVLTLQATISLSIIYSICCHGYERIFKEAESIKILKILSLINNIEEYQKYI